MLKERSSGGQPIETGSPATGSHGNEETAVFPRSSLCCNVKSSENSHQKDSTKVSAEVNKVLTHT
jgi:hypothetical protein